MATAGYHSGYATHTGDIVHALAERLANIAAGFAMQHRHAQTLKALESLSSDELEDIGYPASAREAKPALEIAAGLMTTLMSMR
ncbi:MULTISPECIES: hypothetical protein [unclassified Sinorhizobium]|uniref:hypothetical protein n=1 Tax=unclassified Sinorhizobium TaxID=2613772 RepID=UPI0024C3EE47|nr:MULTISPECIES: hypothetical protein [unclassified Sinorhizobium]MDK1373270.1 hypothetical protein [Sinorhizobium sp. 6-70]MDK1479130.1 hypothetical protein [Sinorhizobium sp. 6-117]